MGFTQPGSGGAGGGVLYVTALPSPENAESESTYGRIDGVNSISLWRVTTRPAGTLAAFADSSGHYKGNHSSNPTNPTSVDDYYLNDNFEHFRVSNGAGNAWINPSARSTFTSISEYFPSDHIWIIGTGEDASEGFFDTDQDALDYLGTQIVAATETYVFFNRTEDELRTIEGMGFFGTNPRWEAVSAGTGGVPGGTGPKGDGGDDGADAVASVLAFLESATVPSAPTVTQDATNDLSFTDSWSLNFPASPTNIVYGIAVRYTLDGTARTIAAGNVEGPFQTNPDTAAQILAKLLTVDGAGSSLDADLLDGMTPAQVAALGGSGGSGGFTLRFGAGVPATALGDNGDWYIATTTGGFYSKASGAWVLRYTDQTGSGGGLTAAQVNALIAAGITDTALATDATTESTTVAASRQAVAEALALKASLTGATFTGAVEVGSSSGGALTVQGENSGNSTIMKIFTPDSGTQKAFGAGREGEFDWVQFAGEIVSGKPGFALGTGTARDTNLYRDAANILRTDDAFRADTLAVTGALTTTQDNLEIAAANPAGADGDRATRLTIRGQNYVLPDDVADVTDVGLPALTADNYRQIFIDHDTPRVWVGHREIIAAVDAVGTFAEYMNANYRGVISGLSPPSSLQAGQFYYSRQNHGWWRGVQTHGIVIGRQVSFGTLFPVADWLGEQPDDATAAGLVDNHSSTRQYLFLNTGSGHVELLNNTTYVAATDRIEHFTAEPISAPNVVGTITGLTAGAGLTGGGSSGQVSLDVDPSEADFPTIPVDKGGTGAVTAAAARIALGIAAGFTLRSGSGAPAAALGDNGDWYLRTSNGQWLEKASGSYVLRYTDMLGTSGGGQTEAQVNTLVQAALAAAVTGNTETGITVTYNADGTLDFVVGTGTAHDLIVGWSNDTAISDAELGAGAAPQGTDINSVTIPNNTGNLYLFVWRADTDGGDPSEVHIAGGGNGRNIFGPAVARTYNGTAGQLIVSVVTQNAGLLSGETLRVV